MVAQHGSSTDGSSVRSEDVRLASVCFSTIAPLHGRSPSRLPAWWLSVCSFVDAAAESVYDGSRCAVFADSPSRASCQNHEFRNRACTCQDRV